MSRFTRKQVDEFICKRICIRCGKNPSKPGFGWCEACETKDMDASKRRYERLKLEHRCVRCGVELPEGWRYVTCGDHIAKPYDKAQATEKRHCENERLKALGKCTRCAIGKPEAGRQWCRACCDYVTSVRLARQARYSAENRCIMCGSKKQDGDTHKLCVVCLDKAKERQRVSKIQQTADRGI